MKINNISLFPKSIVFENKEIKFRLIFVLVKRLTNGRTKARKLIRLNG